MTIDFKNITKNKPKIIIALSFEYANVGDIAIFIAQERMLRKFFPDHQIVEIPMIDYYKYIDELKDIVNDNDLITLIGGGSMGSIYVAAEERRRHLIETFPNNKIISFPQTVDFAYSEKDKEGEKELEKSILVYEKHPNLIFFFREEKSYNFMKKHVKNKCYLVPDTVFYLWEQLDLPSDKGRTDILLCFRDDREKITSNDIKQKLQEALKKNNHNVNIIDTYLGDITFEAHERETILYDLLAHFSKARVAITDRLHGMLFAFITKTPCIAFDNVTHKISATYQTWLKDVPYIKLAEQFDEKQILKYVDELSKLDTSKIQLDFHTDFKHLFDELQKAADGEE